MKQKCKCPPGSPFHWRDDHRASIFLTTNLNKSLKNSQRQTSHIEQERVKGRDVSHVAGLSNKKEHATRTISVNQFVVFSRAGLQL